MTTKPLRGEIWEFDLKAGREPGRTGAYLIVSTNGLNQSEFGTVIICPITPTERPSFLWRVALTPPDLRIADSNWTPREQWVVTDQLLTVETSQRALRHLATVVKPEKLRQIDKSLRLLLDV